MATASMNTLFLSAADDGRCGHSGHLGKCRARIQLSDATAGFGRCKEAHAYIQILPGAVLRVQVAGQLAFCATPVACLGSSACTPLTS